MAHAHVVTCFLRHRGEILLTRRSTAVGTYRGRWAGVSGYVEGDPADALDDARRELREEVGVTTPTLVRVGDPLEVVDTESDDAPREWTVHPFLFDVDTREVRPNEELAAVEWRHATAIHDLDTVPGLWTAYRRIAPTVAAVRDDDTHGSAYVSLRALEVLRDAASEADDWPGVADVARELLTARPSMAAVANRVNAAMAAAERTPEAVRRAAEGCVESAVRADETAAETMLETLESAADGALVSLSRSGTVERVLREAGRAVLVGESRPAREGVDVAEALAPDRDVTLVTDAALAWLLTDEDHADHVPAPAAVVVGADAVLADGSVVNKTGTRGLALAATHEGLPVYAVAAAAKVSTDERMHGEMGPPTAVYDGDAAVTATNPTFDRTPPALIDGVVTEEGVLDATDVREIAERHAANAEWIAALAAEEERQNDEDDRVPPG